MILKEAPFKTSETLPIKTLREVALQAAQGLQFLHDKDYVHKDIKPRNFVVSRGNNQKGELDWICKLTDMGFTKMTSVEGGSWASATNHFGTRSWGLAPELLSKEEELTDEASGSKDKGTFTFPFNQRSDVWALGLVIHFIFSRGGHPYGKTENQWLQNIRDNKPTEQGKESLKKISLPKMRVDLLVEQMIQQDKDNRPKMNDVVSTINGWQLSNE